MFRFLIALLLSMGFEAFAGCRKKQAQVDPAPPPVLVADAITKDVPYYLDEIGTCTAFEYVSIRPQASGQITRIHFTDGADVKTDDMLFTIDPRPYEALLAQSQAAVATNSASLSLAREDFARAQNLIKSKAISKEDFDTRKNAVSVAEAQVQAAQAAVDTAKVNLEYCFIRSPISGRAGLRLVDAGNVVTANSGIDLLDIQRTVPIYADFTITERDLEAVRTNMASGMLKARVRLPDEPDSAAREGDLTFVDTGVSTSGTVKLRVTLQNADRHFWPGQFVRVRLVLNTLKGSVLIPSAATQVSPKGPYAFVLKPDLTVEFREVQLGQRQGDMIVVTSGVQPGEKVVVRGQLALSPGKKVRVVEPSSPATHPSAPQAVHPESMRATGGKP